MPNESQQIAIANSMALIALVKLLDREKTIKKAALIESLDKLISKADAKAEHPETIDWLRWIRDQLL